MELLGMKIGYHSISWDWGRDLLTAITDIAALGYAGTETFASAAKWDAEKLSTLEQHLQKEGLALVTLYHDGSLGHPGQRQLNVDAVEDAAKLLQRLGGEVIVIGGGHPQNLPGEIQEMAKTLNRMGEVAGQYGITVALHPHRGCVVYSEESIDEILSLTDPDLVKFCPDTAHLAMAGMDPVAVIRKYADRIGYVHLKDYKGQEFRGIGTGDLDITGVFDSLKDANYTGWVMIELDDQDEQRRKAEETMAFLKMKFTRLKRGCGGYA